MATTTVRIDVQLRERINSLARAAGVSSGELLTQALAAYEERAHWALFEDAAEALRADPDAWAAEQDNRRLWDRSAADGID